MLSTEYLFCERKAQSKYAYKSRKQILSVTTFHSEKFLWVMF